jgi:Iap family predicted aminopeptidase
MIRVPFEIVFQKVEALYNDESIQTDRQIDKQIKFIADFIEACNWTEEQYQQECFKRLGHMVELDNLPPSPYAVN